MKKIGMLTACLMIGVFFIVGDAAAYYLNNRPYTGLPGTGGETTLQEIFNVNVHDGSGGTLDAIYDQSEIAIWTPAEGYIDNYLVEMLRGDSGQLGIYSHTTGAEYVLLSGNDTTVNFGINSSGALKIENTVVDTNFGSDFGFYWQNTTHFLMSYTEDDKNAAGTGYGDENQNALALAYLVPDGWTIDTMDFVNTISSSGNNDWLLAFEDIAANNGGDGDFNDAVFYIEDIDPVPEPTTMLLVGAGLIGLAGIGRKRFRRT